MSNEERNSLFTRWQSLAAYAPAAPAFPNDDAFYCRFFAEVNSLQDSAGRRLHEVDFREEEGESAFKKCPFHDSRKGYQINNAALKQIASEWGDITHGVKFFASLFPADELDLPRAWRVTLASMFAPLYVTSRSENKIPNGQLDTALAGVFKIMLDVPTTIDLMFMQPEFNKSIHDDVIKALADVDHNDVRDFADKTGILLNGEYACAGSPKLIDDINSLLFEDLSQNFNANSKWSEIFSNQQEFLQFCYIMAAQYVVGQVYLITTATAMEATSQIMNYIAEAEKEPLSAYERRRRVMMNAVYEDGRFDEVMTQFVSALGEGKYWGASNDVSIQNIVQKAINNGQELQSFIKENKAPKDILEAYEAFEAQNTHIVALLQKKAEQTIKSKEIFNDPIRYIEDPSQHPSYILGHRLRAG